MYAAIIAYAVIPMPKYQQKLLHTLLHMIAFVMMAVALSAVFDSHNLAYIFPLEIIN